MIEVSDLARSRQISAAAGSTTSGDTQISEFAATNAETTEPLLAQAIAGDTVALERLLVPYQSRLLSRFRRRMPVSLARVLAAEDLLQESFFEIVRSIRSFVPSGSHAFERWLITIADNRLIDAIRTWAAAKRGGGWRLATTDPYQSQTASLYELVCVDSRTPSRVVAATEMEEAIVQAIERLKDDYRDAVRLRFLENLEIAEVARRLGRSVWSAHKLCARGLHQLEQIVSPGLRSSV